MNTEGTAVEILGKATKINQDSVLDEVVAMFGS